VNSKPVALVTGANKGIGLQIAKDLAAKGFKVIVGSRDLDLGVAAAKSVGAEAEAVQLDVTDLASIAAAARHIQDRLGRLDALVNNAGISRPIKPGMSIEEMRAGDKASLVSIEDMRGVFETNVFGVVAVTQVMLPLLRKAKGQIVFVNSSAGLRSPANAGQFSATQHAFRSVADSLRDEVNVDGIRVLSIFPGRTATPRMEKLFAKEGRAYRPELLLQPEDVAEMVTHALRLPRTAEVTDISIRPMQKSY